MRLLLFAFLLAPTLLLSQVPPVYVVLFTHIEDNTPAGTLGTPQSRQQYMLYRTRLIELANLARTYNIPWSLQPDWKFLLAAVLYEDSTITPSTNNKNLLRYLKEDLGAILDPHSHENGGYNYTDVAHLLDSLGVGSTGVIGGHIWDPSLPQFQGWDRFRVSVSGERGSVGELAGKYSHGEWNAKSCERSDYQRCVAPAGSLPLLRARQHCKYRGRWTVPRNT